MIEVKKFIGSFTGSVYSHYTHKDLNIYQLIFDCIFNRQKTDKASLFYEKIDDFLSTGESENYINLFTSDHKLFAKYYPDVDKIIKVENDNS